MRIILAFQMFFKVLFNREVAEAARRIKQGDLSSPKVDSAPAKPKPVVEPKPKTMRSEAITLLASLQRESRLIDIMKEPLGDYSDEQIGAAARDVLRDAGKVLDRLFDIQPLSDAEEGSKIEAPEGHDPQRFHLIGNVTGTGPVSGSMTHHGWVATKCDLPKWKGQEAAQKIIAPIEIQV